jgi:hypothetical protein
LPPELVLPAFALVLTANAILIALAIRTFTGERLAEDGPAVKPPSGRTGAARPIAHEPAGETPPQRSDPVAAPTASKANGRKARPTAAAGGRRRRFSLPPMDEDHERFNRSISTFLSGGNSADGD